MEVVVVAKVDSRVLTFSCNSSIWGSIVVVVIFCCALEEQAARGAEKRTINTQIATSATLFLNMD